MMDRQEAVGNQLQQIADMLIINGSLLGNPGLWYGKTGVAIFFFLYARHTGIELYENYAVEIFDAIQAEIHWDSTANYDRGLAGIGTGIEYLSQNRFLESDTDEMLEDFDQRIGYDIMYRQQENNSLANGLCGLGQYLLYRLQNRSDGSNELCFLINKESMLHVVNQIENDKVLRPDDFPDLLSFLCRLYPLDICNPKIERCIDMILEKFSIDTIDDEQLHTWVPALLRLSSIRTQIADSARQAIETSLRTFEVIETTFANKLHPDAIYRLLWLQKCKRLLRATEIRVELDGLIDALTENIFCRREDEVHIEKGKLSLKGCAGLGLIMMTLSGRCDDAWLDLLD